MALKQQIQKAVLDSLKGGDQKTSVVLRMTLSSVGIKEKEKRYKISQQKPKLKTEDLLKESELTDEEIIDVISSEIKKRKDAVVLYEKGNRQELADKEKMEIEILQKYLPEQLTLDELKKMVEESINKVGAKDIKDTGKIMADLAPKVKGKADNSQIAQIVKKLLQK